MNLDEMKLAWQQSNQRLEQQMDRQYKLDLAQFKDRKIQSLRAQLMPLIAAQLLQLVMGVLLALWVGSFWFDHRDVPQLLISGLCLHALSIVYIASSVRELALVFGVDYSGPVLAIQRRLTALRNWRVRTVPLFLLSGAVIWIPFLLVACKEWLDVDIYALAPLAVVILTASSLAPVILFLAFIYRIKHRSASAMLNRTINSSIGKSLIRAQASMEELARFETE